MSQESDLDQTVTVSRGDVTVEKAFEPDEFPVPAVTFRIESTDPDPVELRLVDQIPEEFPMSTVGFHPDFESDNWSAYQDHRVVFECTLEPDEVVRTVYGVRLDREEDALAFLDEPTLEGIEESTENVEDILGEDRNQAVRDVLAGDRDSLVEEDGESVASDDSESDQDSPEIELQDPTANEGQAENGEREHPVPRSLGEGVAPAVEEVAPDATIGETPEVTGEEETDEEKIDKEEVTDESDADERDPGTEKSEIESESENEPTLELEDEPDATTGSTAESSAPVGAAAGATAGGVAEALAQEIREGDVAEDDLELLREELDLGLPRSADVRIQRLQRTVADLNAYADALEEFIDEEGTAEELIDSFRGDVEQLSEAVAELEADLEATGEDVETLRSDLTSTDHRLEGVDEDVQDLETDVEDLDEEIDTVDDEVKRITNEMEHVTDEIADVTDDVETLRDDLDEEIDAVEQRLESTTDDLETTVEERLEEAREEMDRTVDDVLAQSEANSEQLAALEAQFQEFEEFRDRLEEAFGGMGGVNTDNE